MGDRKGQMRIITFNLRFENDRDGENAWPNRRDLVVEIIERYSPDILGTQEGKWSQLTFLKDRLADYSAHIPKRSSDAFLQCPTLFIRKDRFEVLGGKDFWLSKTPEVFLSKDWDSAFPRMMSYGEIRHRPTGKIFHAAVTHLDHMGVEARYNQARLIAQWARELHTPVVLMGDFNDGPDSQAHQVLTVPETGLQDTWQCLEKSEDTATSYTHHGFTGIPQVARMDWILVGPSFHVTHTQIIHDHRDGRYPSDHFPYMADLVCKF